MYEPTPVSDTESESTSDESDSDQNFYITASDGQKVNVDKDQIRDKSHHLNIFPSIKIPETFDLQYVKSLKDYQARLKYVRDPSKLPEETVLTMQMKLIQFFQSKQTEAFPGYLGKNRIEGTLYIDKRQRVVAFVNKSDSKCRTFVKMSERQLENLEERRYIIFPNI
jgi:hypothetical protein